MWSGIIPRHVEVRRRVVRYNTTTRCGGATSCGPSLSLHNVHNVLILIRMSDILVPSYGVHYLHPHQKFARGLKNRMPIYQYDDSRRFLYHPEQEKHKKAY